MNFQMVLKHHSEVSLDNCYISLSKWSIPEPGEVSVFLVLFISWHNQESLPLLMFVASSKEANGDRRTQGAALDISRHGALIRCLCIPASSGSFFLLDFRLSYKLPTQNYKSLCFPSSLCTAQ